MAEVDTTQIEQVVTDIVNDAHRDGSIDELTPRMIRSRAEERLGLEGGTLDAWKEAVKRAATRAIDALDADDSATASDEEDVKPAKSTPKSKAASSATSSAKRKSTNDGTPPSKKPRTSSISASESKGKKATAKKVKEAKEEGVGKKKQNGKVVRSASVIPSSDEEDESTSKSPVAKKTKAKRPPLPKNTSAHDADVSTAEVGDGDVGGGDIEPTPKDGVKPTSKKAGKSKSQESATAQDEGAESVTADDESVGAGGPGEGEAEGGGGGDGKGEDGGGGEEGDGKGEKSESEMSVLIDEEPAKKRRGKGTAKKEGGKSKSKSKKESGKGKSKAKKDTGEEDAEDGEIKRLKSFITACGVRKLWSREFASHSIPPLPSSTSSSTPSQVREIKLAQIRHLKGMLKELGMEGRLSMEKARRVRERRELARELEDVQTFEKAVVHGTSTRSSRSAHHKSGMGAATSGGNESDVEDALDDRKKGGDGDGEGDSEEEVVGKSRRKVNARQSIMAFLGDQSDSE